MRELIIATANAGKIKEFESLLANRFECIPLSDLKSPPPVEETGSTYFENALIKALRYYEHYQIPCLSDDSGLEVDALGGQPGVYSARFGGEELSWKERWEFLYGELGTLPSEQWSARFRSVLCFYEGKGVPKFFEGSCEGRILPQPAGKEGFGYDPIFYSNDLKKSFGVASFDEKQRISHRARSVVAFLSSGIT